MPPIFLLAAAGGEFTAQVVTVIIAFFTVMYILVRLTWGPILAHLDERRQTVATEFQSIERRQADLESRIRDYEERLRQIDSEARARLNKAIDEGKHLAAEIVEEARRESDEMKRKASADIAIEVEKARLQLRDEVVSLTIGATQKLLHSELNDTKHRELVAGFVADLQDRKAS